jgi:uncharacterized protein (TIGR02569 family)
VPPPFPSSAVLRAFGLRGEPERLPGGQGDAFVVGNAVIKFVADSGEAEWVQGLLHRLDQDGFRCADPLLTTGGRWVHEGWIANAFIADLRPVAPDWDRVIEFGLRFCDAAETARHGDGSVLARRTHRWAVADRVAWNEERVTFPDPAGALLDELLLELVDDPNEVQFVHGDLSGNVFMDARRTAVILDVSPYIRPRRWATAIILADAVLWHGADVDSIRSYASDASGSDLMRRALVFRLVADQLSDHPQPQSLVSPYHIALDALT